MQALPYSMARLIGSLVIGSGIAWPLAISTATRIKTGSVIGTFLLIQEAVNSRLLY